MFFIGHILVTTITYLTADAGITPAQSLNMTELMVRLVTLKKLNPPYPLRHRIFTRLNPLLWSGVMVILEVFSIRQNECCPLIVNEDLLSTISVLGEIIAFGEHRYFIRFFEQFLI